MKVGRKKLPKAEKAVSVSFTLHQQQKAKLTRIAKDWGITRSQVIERLIDEVQEATIIR